MDIVRQRAAQQLISCGVVCQNLRALNGLTNGNRDRKRSFRETNTNTSSHICHVCTQQNGTYRHGFPGKFRTRPPAGTAEVVRCVWMANCRGRKPQILIVRTLRWWHCSWEGQVNTVWCFDVCRETFEVWCTRTVECIELGSVKVVLSNNRLLFWRVVGWFWCVLVENIVFYWNVKSWGEAK